MRGTFDRHGAVEFGVPRLPDGAEVADADGLDQMKVTDCLLAFRPEAGCGRIGRETETAAAGRAVDVLEGAVVNQFDRVVTMRATDVHR